MFAGWITFSADEDDGATVAQAQVLMRASDPLFELGLMLGGHGQENRFWEHTLKRWPRTSAHEAESRRPSCAWTSGASGRVAQRLAQLGDPLDDLHPRRSGRAVKRLFTRGRTVPEADPDAVVVGAGPNGLAAAIALAQAATVAPRGADTVGGGASAGADPAGLRPRHLLGGPPDGHRLALLSRAPAGRVRPGVVHPAVRSPTRSTAARRCCSTLGRRRRRGLGRDERAYRRLIGPPVADAAALVRPARPVRLPRHPGAARFGLGPALGDGAGVCFPGDRARALFDRLGALGPAAAHADRRRLGLVLGWAPTPSAGRRPGGSQRIADALAGYFRSLGGGRDRAPRRASTNSPARPGSFDMTPRQSCDRRGPAAGRLAGR